MDYGPLANEEIAAGAELARRFDKYAPVRAVFWMKESDDPYRYLYIAAEGLESQKSAAYDEVVRLATQMDSPDLNVFRAKLISATNQLARAAIEQNTHFPSDVPVRQGGMRFGGTFAEDLCVYPWPMGATILRTVQLAEDVAAAFPDAASVNEALRESLRTRRA